MDKNNINSVFKLDYTGLELENFIEYLTSQNLNGISYSVEDLQDRVESLEGDLGTFTIDNADTTIKASKKTRDEQEATFKIYNETNHPEILSVVGEKEDQGLKKKLNDWKAYIKDNTDEISILNGSEIDPEARLVTLDEIESQITTNFNDRLNNCDGKNTTIENKIPTIENSVSDLQDILDNSIDEEGQPKLSLESTINSLYSNFETWNGYDSELTGWETEVGNENSTDENDFFNRTKDAENSFGEFGELTGRINKIQTEINKTNSDNKTIADRVDYLEDLVWGDDRKSGLSADVPFLQQVCADVAVLESTTTQLTTDKNTLNSVVGSIESQISTINNGIKETNKILNNTELNSAITNALQKIEQLNERIDKLPPEGLVEWAHLNHTFTEKSPTKNITHPDHNILGMEFRIFVETNGYGPYKILMRDLKSTYTIKIDSIEIEVGAVVGSASWEWFCYPRITAKNFSGQNVRVQGKYYCITMPW